MMKRLLKEYQEYVNNKLLPHMQKQLGFNKPPTINFVEDEQNAKDVFGKTAFYDPTSMEITVFVSGRHPKDIMRSVAHEIVHHNQNCNGKFDNLSNIGEQGYAQSNPHLRNMEKEAYLLGNMIFRDWEDNYKKQRNFNSMTESILRRKIRSLIKESMEEMGGDSMQDASSISNESEHYEGDACEPSNPSHIEYLEKMERMNLQGYTAKRDDYQPAITEEVSLKEWKNNELNSLLLKRFGIISEKRFANNKKLDNDGDGVPKWADKDDHNPKIGSKPSTNEEEEELDERKLSSSEKKKLKGLHKSKTSMKKAMIKQYGKKKGEKVFYAETAKEAKGDKQ